MAVSVLAFGDFALRTPDVLFLGIEFSHELFCDMSSSGCQYKMEEMHVKIQNIR